MCVEERKPEHCEEPQWPKKSSDCPKHEVSSLSLFPSGAYKENLNQPHGLLKNRGLGWG